MLDVTNSKAQPKAKARLVRQDWIDTAIRVLAEEGIGAVTIETLASRLRITRGSFYHHFAGREDLLRAMLDHWARRWTYEVRDQIAALGLDPGTTLFALMRAIRGNRAADYDAPFRAWALHDPLARSVVEEVDKARFAVIHQLFEGLGFIGLDAENRARLFLHYEMAAPAMFAGPSPERDEELLKERHRFLTTARELD
jgi:AcrR family transcriptional regulator